MSLIAGVSKFCEFVPMKDDGEPRVGRPRTVKLDDAAQERSDRAIRIRKAAGYEQQNEFAREYLKIEPSRWNNCERGKPISRDVETKLIQKMHGLTRGYVQDGDTRGMPDDLLIKLGERPDPSHTPSKGPRTPRLSRR